MGKKSFKESKQSGDKSGIAKTATKSIDKKQKLKDKLKKNQKPNSARLPSNKDEYSANWKQMLMSIQKEQKTSQKPKGGSKGNTGIKDKKKIQTKSSGTAPVKKPEIWFDVKDETLLDPQDRPSASGVITIIKIFVVLFTSTSSRPPSARTLLQLSHNEIRIRRKYLQRTIFPPNGNSFNIVGL